MNERANLVKSAIEARERARAQYSDFPVGAAVLTRSGKIFQGCNIESVSFRLTVCAEEVAIGAAVVSGETDFVAIAVVADSKHPIVPCGGCRQLLAEFNPSIEVMSATVDGQTEIHSLSELLPLPRQGILEKRNGR